MVINLQPPPSFPFALPEQNHTHRLAASLGSGHGLQLAPEIWVNHSWSICSASALGNWELAGHSFPHPVKVFRGLKGQHHIPLIFLGGGRTCSPIYTSFPTESWRGQEQKAGAKEQHIQSFPSCPQPWVGVFPLSMLSSFPLQDHHAALQSCPDQAIISCTLILPLQPSFSLERSSTERTS